MTVSVDAPASPEFRKRLEGGLGIRWTDQRAKEAAELERGGRSAGDVTEMLNGETHFFRFPFYLDVLRSHFEQSEDVTAPYRVHCAGCSTGEEVYSAAFSLRDSANRAAADIEISGSDARASAIEIARNGLYGQWSLRGVSPSLQATLFTAEGNRYRVRESFRRGTRFSVKNLLDPYDQTYDAIFLCNATLYMTEDAAQKTYRLAAAALQPNGLLFVAPTDPIPSTPELGRHLKYRGWPIFGRADETGRQNSTLREEARAHVAAAVPRPLDDVSSASPLPFGQRASDPMPSASESRTAAPAASFESTERDAVLHAWAKGDLASVETPLRRLVFLASDNPLWRFLLGCLQWEQGWLRRARKELDAARLLVADLPDERDIEGVCSARGLREMIDYWKGEVA